MLWRRGTSAPQSRPWAGRECRGLAMTTAYLGLADALRGQPALGEASSDDKLIQRIAAGDRLAMRTLFARHRVAVYRWLLRFAEDLLSDMFVDVWRQAASFEARASVSTWLLAIARYKA